MFTEVFDMKIIESVCIWGDSILKGIAFNETKQKYYTMQTTAIDILASCTSINIKNFSRFGCTTDKALVNLENKLEKGLNTQMAIIELGGNDCDHYWEEISKDPDGKHHAKIEIDDFCDNLIKIIKMLINNNIVPIIMNLPPINSERYFNWISSLPNVKSEKIMYWLKQKDIIYRNQEKYSNAICKLAQENSVHLIDVRNEFLSAKNLNDYLCIDGIHLNEKGQQVLGKTMLKYFHENINVDTTTVLNSFSKFHSHSH